MYTVEEIRNITFSKTMGGYKTAEVDDFIDICADTVEALEAEKADLQKKMEVLANKIIEYRNDEDSIRTALLNAQRMGDTVLREANHKAELILEDAKIKAEKAEEIARQQIQDELDELDRMKKAVADFKKQILGIYREHLAIIDVLPDYKTEEKTDEEVTEAEAEVETEETVAPVEEQPVETAEEAIAEVEAEEVVEEDEATLFGMDEPANAQRFANLKFGADYNISEDADMEDASANHRWKKS